MISFVHDCMIKSRPTSTLETLRNSCIRCMLVVWMLLSSKFAVFCLHMFWFSTFLQETVRRRLLHQESFVALKLSHQLKDIFFLISVLTNIAFLYYLVLVQSSPSIAQILALCLMCVRSTYGIVRRFSQGRTKGNRWNNISIISTRNCHLHRSRPLLEKATYTGILYP